MEVMQRLKTKAEQSAATRGLIVHSFLKLLEDHPLNRITIKMLTDTCMVDRQTFYYYFKDMDDLIKRVFEDLIAPAIDQASKGGSMSDVLTGVLVFLEDYRQPAKVILESGGYGRFRAAFRNDVERVFNAAVVPDLMDQGLDAERAVRASGICLVLVVDEIARCVMDSCDWDTGELVAASVELANDYLRGVVCGNAEGALMLVH